MTDRTWPPVVYPRGSVRFPAAVAGVAGIAALIEQATRQEREQALVGDPTEWPDPTDWDDVVAPRLTWALRLFDPLAGFPSNLRHRAGAALIRIGDVLHSLGDRVAGERW